MSIIETYEQNLEQRLKELREGDRAYTLHQLAIADAIVFAGQLHGQDGSQRILDVGCGLGFSTAYIKKYWDVVGIDISKKAIALAKDEHPETPFYDMSADTFSERMPELGIEPFDQAVLNMVLHSVDDQSAINILKGARKCIKKEGSVLIIIPSQKWLMQKLIEYAQDQGMSKETGIPWIKDQLGHNSVELPIKIRGGEYYTHPITIYNRSEADYGNLLLASGFKVPIDNYDADTEQKTGSMTIPYWKMDDYLVSMNLTAKDRDLLLSFAFD